MLNLFLWFWLRRCHSRLRHRCGRSGDRLLLPDGLRRPDRLRLRRNVSDVHLGGILRLHWRNIVLLRLCSGRLPLCFRCMLREGRCGRDRRRLCNRWCRHNRLRWRNVRLGIGGCQRGGGKRLCYARAIQQRIVLVILLALGGPVAGEEHVVRIGGDATGAVLHLFLIVHAPAREERCIGFTAERISKLLCYTLTAGENATHNAGTARLAPLCSRLVVLLFVVILFVIILFVIDPGIIPASTVAGKRENIEQHAADLLGDADPRPAGKQRQPGSPDAEQRDRASAAVQQRHHGSAQQAANHPAGGKVPDIIGIDGG